MLLIGLLVAVASGLATAASFTGGPRVVVDVSREVSFRDTAIADGAGGLVYARAIRLTASMGCERGRARHFLCSVDDARLIGVPTAEDTGSLLPALQHAEARAESVMVEVTLARSGRLLDVRAMEQDGVLWREWPALSRWLRRALSPLDTRRRVRPGGTWIRDPAWGALFGGEVGFGLRMRVEADASGGLTQVGGGVWAGPPRLDVTATASQRVVGGVVVQGHVSVSGVGRADPTLTYRLEASVHAVGDASVGPLVSAEVPAL